jgi:NADPH-ferrihemoprotein reductase
VILLITVGFFTKGTLWGIEEERYPGDGKDFGKLSGLGGNSSSSRDIIQKMNKNDKNVVIFYGSQTGTAEDYASRMAKEASSKYGLKTMVADVDNFDFENLDQFPEDQVMGLVMATYGEGEPTDNAVAFYEFITSPDVSFSNEEDASSQPLRNLNYVLFGLGNSTYEFFNQVGRQLDETLQKLGAHRIGPYGEGDDGNGTMEEDYLAWKDELFLAWKTEKNLEEHEAVYEPTIEVIEEFDTSCEDPVVYVGEPNKKHLEGESFTPFNATNPFLAKVGHTRELFKSPSRNCIHLELDITDSGIRYTTGDHLAFWPQNSNDEVARFLKIFGLDRKKDDVINIKKLDPTAKVPFPIPTTYDTVVRYYLEINGPVSRQLISSVAPFAPSEAAKKRAIELGSDKVLFANEVTAHYLNTARLLETISNGEIWDKVPFSFIIESLQHLQPRYYSISSSSLVDKNTISITAVVESIKPVQADHTLKGVATNYILDIKKSIIDNEKNLSYHIAGPRGKYIGSEITRVPIHVRHSNFKLPSKPTKPIIMIGPGTGVAPFRGFIHERAQQARNGTPVGPAVLFFGCRTSKEDHIYAEEWASFSERAVDETTEFTEKNFLHVFNAFSREGPEKVYVQHRLEENAEYVNKLLKDGAFLYVCGDANRMARDVQATVARIMSQQRDIPLKKAEELIKSMKAQNIYQEDVW